MSRVKLGQTNIYSPFSIDESATTEIYTLSLHDALPISPGEGAGGGPSAAGVAAADAGRGGRGASDRSEEHTSELQSRRDLVCRLLLEKKKHGTSRPFWS